MQQLLSEYQLSLPGTELNVKEIKRTYTFSDSKELTV